MNPTPPEQPTPAELPDDVPTLQTMVQELQAVVAALQEEVRRLREQTNRNSGNSSRPPSSDLPWHQRPRKPPTGKKRGGQKGHPGACRRLAPPNSVDHVVVTPSTCGHCGEAFPPALPRRRKFRRWQVVELPPIQPVITEYQLHARRCRTCGRRTWAELPQGISRRCVGPRVQALAALLAGTCRVSRRQVQTLLRDLCGIRISLGTLMALEADTAQALAAPYREVATAVAQAPLLGVDETSWREAGVLHWLWTAVTPRFTFYRIDRHRSRAACAALLGGREADPPPEPVLITDRYSAYGHLPDGRHSLCWAHLARDFRAAEERGGIDGAVGRWALDVLGQILAPWHQYRQGQLDREALLAAVQGRCEELRPPLRWGAAQGTRPTRALCRYLLEHWASLWTWLDYADGEPTNNAAERALRPAVLWRKSSFGHQSDVGEQFAERMLTVAGTLRLQQGNLWDYLVQTCQAAVHRQVAPSLLPQPST